GDEAEIGAAELQHVLLFLALRLRHDNDGAIAQRIADQSQTNPGIAGGPLDDDAAGTEQAARFGVADDGKRRAVLYRAAGIEELGLAEDGAAGHLRGAAEPNQRRVADSFKKSVANLHRPRPCLGVGSL